MGTNYYLKPKGYDKLDWLNKSTNIFIESVLKSYKDELNKMIKESDEICPIYQEILDRADPDNIQIKLQYEFEEPDVHICKISAGWIPLFEKNKYYSNFKEFESFYKKYKKYFTFIDEYNREIDFNKFKVDIFKRVSDKSNQTHTQYNSFFNSEHQYYKDENGIEWIDNKFS